MNEMFHVIQHEYLKRVRTKSFVLITLLTPLLLSMLFILPTYFATKHEDLKQMKIGFVDPDNVLNEAFDDSDFFARLLSNQTVEDIKNLVLSNEWEGIVYVKKSDSAGTAIQFYSSKQPSVFLLNQIRSSIQRVIVSEKLVVYGISDVNELIHSASASITVENIRVSTEKTQIVSYQYQRPLCMVIGVTIYMFVLLFASQVMRSVMEEKSNRIVELIITSISPVKFMAGKIAGVALVGLTQIACWIILMNGLMMFLSNFADITSSGSMNFFVNQRISQEDVDQILSNLNQIDFNAIIPAFAFFFIGGYLLYSSIFAAIAATANHSDDIQRITMIVTFPLILAILVLSNTINGPDSSLSYWFSIIPFTSPIVMMGRIVYGAPVQDILLSIFFLIATVVLIVWLSGKIYKMAILYSGKKMTGKEILSWIRNSNN